MLSGWLAALAIGGVVLLLGNRPSPAARLHAVGGATHTESRPRAPDGFAVMALAGVSGTAIVAFRLPAVAVSVIAAAVVVGLRLRRARRAARLRAAARAASVEVTFALAAELRAGRTPAEAIAAVADIAGPLRPALRAAHAAVSVGADPAAELARAAAVPGAHGLAAVAAAWTVAASAGGRVAAVLERLAESMDRDDELRQQLAAAMAAPRATMVLLAALPLLGIGLGQAVGAHPLDLLLHRPLGWGLLGVALVLDGLGVCGTRAIAARALRT